VVGSRQWPGMPVGCWVTWWACRAVAIVLVGWWAGGSLAALAWRGGPPLLSVNSDVEKPSMG
jgi:hypothetical protein